jgi:hypothetical protein
MLAKWRGRDRNGPTGERRRQVNEREGKTTFNLISCDNSGCDNSIRWAAKCCLVNYQGKMERNNVYSEC